MKWNEKGWSVSTNGYFFGVLGEEEEGGGSCKRSCLQKPPQKQVEIKEVFAGSACRIGLQDLESHLGGHLGHPANDPARDSAEKTLESTGLIIYIVRAWRQRK